MSVPSPSSWPTPSGNIDVIRPGNILWKTVKTEEEEYLDKLQSKLSRIMQNGHATSSVRTENADIDPDDLPEDLPSARPLHDDDPGLHLLYEFPDQGRRPPSPTSSTQSDPTPKLDVPRPRLVRFRSRVRITSGVHPPPPASGSSSTCESISSSISAPLRGLRREANARPTPLSGMLSADMASAWLRGMRPARKSGHERQRGEVGAVDEHSPLTSGNGFRVRAYMAPSNEDEDDDAEYERMQAAARKSEEAVMFGRWPWRFINRHWWWWKLEPFLCCCARFDDESDED